MALRWLIRRIWSATLFLMAAVVVFGIVLVKGITWLATRPVEAFRWLFGIDVPANKNGHDGIAIATTLFGSVLTLTLALLAVFATLATRDASPEQVRRYLICYTLLSSGPVLAMTGLLRARENKHKWFTMATVKFIYWSIAGSLALIAGITAVGFSNGLPGLPQHHPFQIADVEDYRSEQSGPSIKAHVYLNQSIYQDALPRQLALSVDLLGELGTHWEFVRIDLFELTGREAHEISGASMIERYSTKEPNAILLRLKPDGAYRLDLYFAPLDDKLLREEAKRLILNSRTSVRIAQEANRESIPKER